MLIGTKRTTTHNEELLLFDFILCLAQRLKVWFLRFSIVIFSIRVAVQKVQLFCREHVLQALTPQMLRFDHTKTNMSLRLRAKLRCKKYQTCPTGSNISTCSLQMLQGTLKLVSFDPYLTDDCQGSHEEGEHHRRFLDRFQSIQNAQANHLHKSVKVHTLHWQFLDVFVLRVILWLPDHPQEETVKEAVAGEGSNSHVKENALQNCPWQKFQHRSQQKRQSNPELRTKLNLNEVIGHFPTHCVCFVSV